MPAPPAPVPAKQSPSPPKKLDKQWIPDPTGLVVGVRWNRLHAQARSQAAFQTAWPEGAKVGQRLLAHFHIGPEKVEYLFWFAVEGNNWADQSVLLMGLAEDAPLDELSQRGQAVGFRLAQAEFRREPNSAWPFPFALVGNRWILTGPEVLLRHLTERPKPQLQSRALDRMVENWPWEADLAVGVDSSWLRSLAGSSVPRWATVWPEARRPFLVLWEVPIGFFTGMYLGESVRLETALWCQTASEAEQVRAAGEELLGSAGSGLDRRLQRLGEQVQAGLWKADRAAEYEKLLRVGSSGVRSARLEVAETVVWCRTAWKTSWPELIESIPTAQESVRRDWQEAAAEVIQEQEHRLWEALQAYCKAEGHFPPGAEGGPLWNPETRLSWIALVLPYLGQADWYGQLQLRYPWNSPQNKAVAQRPLETVLNPAIWERRTEAGFPVTHYVGVAGFGEDAAQPKADPRRIGVFGFGRTLKPEEITDGLSHTIAIAGVSSRLGPWASGGSATVRPFTQPPYVNGPDGFGTGQPDGMFVGMADGSVRFISKEVDPRVLEMLATARGMERIEGLAWEVGPKPIRPATGPSPKMPTTKPPVAGPGPSETAKTQPSESPGPGPTETKPPAETPSSEKPPTVAEKEKNAGPSPAEQQAETETRLAEKIVSLELPAVPLRKAVSLLEAISGLRITYDLDEMEAAGASLDTPVRLKQTDASVGEILRAMLDPLGLTYMVEGNNVLISRADAAQQEIRSVRYDVSDLATGAESEPEDIARLLERFVLPESWQHNGGRGKIEIRDEVLLVHQTDLGHRRVVEVLEKLRLARGLPLRIDPGRKDLSLQTRRQQMRSVLERAITANFPSPTPLPEILAYLEQVGQLTILVDWASVQTEGWEPNRTATLRVHQQPLAEALKNLLEPLGLSYRIAGPELVQITTLKALAMRLEVEFYPAGEAITALGSPKALLDAIKNQVGRDTWEDNGGSGCIWFDPASKYLMILQSAPIHAELERFLSGMKAPQTGSP